MKKIILPMLMLCAWSCSNKEVKNDAPKIMCDTVQVAMYDSAGNEMMVKQLKCDTVKPQE